MRPRIPRYITSEAIEYYTPESYARHLKEIQSHERALRALRKVKADARRAAFAVPKPPPKAYSWKVNPKGLGVLTIRGRKPVYLTREEYQCIRETFPDQTHLLDATIKRRKIPIQENS